MTVYGACRNVDIYIDGLRQAQTDSAMMIFGGPRLTEVLMAFWMKINIKPRF